MARRNLRAAGEFCSYPSALKPSACLEGKERERQKATKGKRMRGGEQTWDRKKRYIMFFRKTRKRGKERVI